MKMQLAIVCALIGFAASANGTATYRDAMGRNHGSASTYGNRTTYRDTQGRLQGSAQTSNSGTTYRDASGRLQGSSRTDASGRTTSIVTQWDAYRERQRPIPPVASPIETGWAVWSERPQRTPLAASPIVMPKAACKAQRSKHHHSTRPSLSLKIFLLRRPL